MVVLGVMHYAPVPPLISRHILEEARKRSIATTYVRPSEVSLYIDNSGLSIYIRGKRLSLDLLFVRGVLKPSSIEEASFNHDVLYGLEHVGTLVINSPRSIMLAKDKFLTSLTLSKHNLPYPPSLASLGMTLPLNFLEEWKQAVVKPLIGSLGRGVIPLDNPDVAYSVFRQLIAWSQPILLQKLVDKPGNRDLRVLVIDGQVVAHYYRIASEGKFKTNVHQGARVERAENIDAEVLESAVKAVDALGLFYGGVDIILTRDSYYILEVNSIPSWRGALQLGINPAPILVDRALALLKK